jgi:hypothetical protein
MVQIPILLVLAMMSHPHSNSSFKGRAGVGVLFIEVIEQKFYRNKAVPQFWDAKKGVKN